MGDVIISTSLGDSMTYFSPASVAPPWTRPRITVLWFWGFGGCIAVTGTLSIFILANHSSTLNTSSTTARALKRMEHRNTQTADSMAQNYIKKTPQKISTWTQIQALHVKTPLIGIIIWIKNICQKTLGFFFFQYIMCFI